MRQSGRSFKVRCLASVLLGMAVTLGTAWGPAIVSGIRDYGLAYSQRSAVPETAVMKSVRDGPRYTFGSVVSSFWSDEWILDFPDPEGHVEMGPPLNPTTTRAAAASWAVQPPRSNQNGERQTGDPGSVTTAYGVPFRCARSWFLVGTFIAYDFGRRWSLSIGGGSSIELPVGPIWLGLVADVAVWSVSPALLLLGVPAWRRRQRRRAGKCETCGYAVNASGAVCPECGNEVRGRCPGVGR